jgi:hypothetical protein
VAKTRKERKGRKEMDRHTQSNPHTILCLHHYGAGSVDCAMQLLDTGRNIPPVSCCWEHQVSADLARPNATPRNPPRKGRFFYLENFALVLASQGPSSDGSLVDMMSSQRMNEGVSQVSFS